MINVGPGKFDNKDKHMALNIYSPWKKFQNLINVGPTFIPDYRVLML